MGDRLRKYTKQLWKLAVQAGLPSLLIYGILLGSFVLRGTPQNGDIQPIIYLRLLIVCYLIVFVVTCVLHYKDMIHAILRADEHLIGKNFGGFRKQDKLFCTGMEAYAADRPREALEYFLAVQNDFELTEAESGVLAFYLGRCYQMLDCPANAVSYYQSARAKGFSEPFAKLFEARSYAECGDFANSLAHFQDLLANDPPAEFYFLYTDIGYLYIKQNQPEQAEEWFRKSIEQKQNYAFALGGMAIAALQKGNFAEAQDYHYKALINHLENAVGFRKYYEETKRLMLDAHPEWSEKIGAHPETDTAKSET